MGRKIIRADETVVRAYAPGDGTLCFNASFNGKAGGCEAVTEDEARQLTPDGWELFKDGPYWRAREMPKVFDITVPMVLAVRVTAATEAEAIAIAQGWANWIDPHDDQLDDYMSDHPEAKAIEPFGFGGVLTVSGDITAAPAEGEAPGGTR